MPYLLSFRVLKAWWPIFLKSVLVAFFILSSILSLAEESDNLNLEPTEKTEDLFLNFDNPIDKVPAQVISGLELHWRASFKASSFSDDTTSNAVVGTEVDAYLEWLLTPAFHFKFHTLFIGRNGFTQSIYDRDDRRGGVYLLESFFQWNLNSQLSLLFGSIRQDFLQAPLLVTDKTFPSFKMDYKWSYSDALTSSFLFQASIPDNAQELVKRETQIIKGFPLFSVGSFYMESKSLPLLSSFFNRFTFFHYYNLSQAVAERSRIYRNTIVRSGSDSGFKYKYQGFHNHFNFVFPLSSFFIGEGGLEYINNFSAPLNEGYRAYTNIYYKYKDFVEFRTFFEYFANEADASVAYYNSAKYGHNDRKGFLARLEFYFYESGLSFGLSFVNSRPIDSDDETSIGPANMVSVFLTTNYIKI